jgi:acetyl-CoA carboxylase biotin carboxyl carrier protein
MNPPPAGTERNATVNVDTDKLKALLEILIENDIGEFEHEDESARIRIVRGTRAAAHAVGHVVPAHAARPHHETAVHHEPAVPDDSVDVTSPFVGTFYRSPSPDSPTFVEVGSVVRPGQTLCIIEAMKLMNEIEADCSGTIVEVFAQNGKAVEFGQKLFRIKKA